MRRGEGWFAVYEEATVGQVRDVAFLVFDGVKLLDVSGPAEVFAEANLFGADYRLSYVSPAGQPVRTSVGATLPVDSAATDVRPGGTVVVAGGDVLVTHPIPRDLVDAAARLAVGCDRLVSICTGSFVLASAGLLDGRRATTHWRHAALLSRSFRGVAVQPDAIFVEDRGIFTSAGVSAGIDLALSLVEQDHGSGLAREVARNLVVFMQRPGGQSQFSAGMQLPPARTPLVRKVVDHVTGSPADEHSTASLAALAGLSPRHLTRLFVAELNTTPGRFVEQCRLDRAKTLLERGCMVSETARAAGFGSPESLRRSFRTNLGISPSEYAARFSTTGDDKSTDA